MQLARSDQQVLLEQALERYLLDRYSFAQRSKVLASDTAFSREHWAFFAEMGLLALPFDEADGGYGGSLAEVMSVMRLFGKSLVLEPYLSCVVLAGRLLAHTTDRVQKDRWLTPLMSGERLVGLAHLERGERRGAAVAQTKVTKRSGELVLDGAKMLAPANLDAFLVTARDEGGALHICVVPTQALGVETRRYRTVDGAAAADVTFSGVKLSPQDVLALPDADAALADALACADAALSAEALGCMQAVFDMTLDYAKTRQQFGRPIGEFQAIKHRLADCHTLCAAAEAMVERASYDNAADWPAAVAAARALVCDNALHVGHEAIQIHGGMGMTDELAVSHYHKRIVMISRLGDVRAQTETFIRRGSLADHGTPGSALPFEALLSAKEQEFRSEVADFLQRRLSPELQQAVRNQTSTFPEKDVAVAWQQRLAEKGWLAPLWPAELGGTGWSPVQRFVFEYECAIAGAPERVPMGFRYVGPVIAQYGSDWQRAHFLPKMLASEHYWAQGFSEPGAGSDLAAIKTTAVLSGDHYVLNGSKMWTTHAHYANWLFVIARTEKSEKPQEGISFLLVDMSSPGIRVEPIALLTADREVNQVFFDDVRVPVTHLVGEPGRGWDYAKYLLELERGGAVFCGRLRYELNEVKRLINATDADLWSDPVFSHRLAALERRLMALEFIEFKQSLAMKNGKSPGVGGSLTKLIASELQKDIAEAGMQAAGCAGLEFNPPRLPLHLQSQEPSGLDVERAAMPRYLNMRVASIYGGSSEIQREIIAKHALGLR